MKNDYCRSYERRPADESFEPEWEKFASELGSVSSYEFEIAERFFAAGLKAGALLALTHPDDAVQLTTTEHKDAKNQ